jgi:tetratricopeptide (TPR) repeat protein
MEKLVAFYAHAQNNIKLRMATEELDSLKKTTRQDYVIIGETLGPNLHPQKSIPDAEKLYQQARLLDDNPDLGKADENKKKALDLYLELMSRFPESIRIADSAFYSAVIYENTIKDYYRAVIYYQRTYEWDPLTSHPAQIQAARICFSKLNENGMARRLYEAASNSAAGTPTDRAEAKSMTGLLKAWGF